MTHSFLPWRLTDSCVAKYGISFNIRSSNFLDNGLCQNHCHQERGSLTFAPSHEKRSRYVDLSSPRLDLLAGNSPCDTLDALSHYSNFSASRCSPTATAESPLRSILWSSRSSPSRARLFVRWEGWPLPSNIAIPNDTRLSYHSMRRVRVPYVSLFNFWYSLSSATSLEYTSDLQSARLPSMKE